MFIGHFAVGFAARRAAPESSLAVLMGAASLLDLIFPVFVLAGWESVRIGSGANPFLRTGFFYPFSHSLVATFLWAAAAALGYWAVSRKRRGALVVWFAVMSHWLLDFISHQPDMPLYPGNSPLAGLGLWRSVAGTMVVEGLMLAAGIWLYGSVTRACSRGGVYGMWSFAGFLVIAYIANIAGPPPPGARAFAGAGLASAVLLVWVAWFDSQRQAVIPSGRPAGRKGPPNSGNAPA
jgi:hypothetical protein